VPATGQILRAAILVASAALAACSGAGSHAAAGHSGRFTAATCPAAAALEKIVGQSMVRVRASASQGEARDCVYHNGGSQLTLPPYGTPAWPLAVAVQALDDPGPSARKESMTQVRAQFRSRWAVSDARALGPGAFQAYEEGPFAGGGSLGLCEIWLPDAHGEPVSISVSVTGAGHPSPAMSLARACGMAQGVAAQLTS
jgi:hypothetical protein